MKQVNFAAATAAGFPELHVKGWALDTPGLYAWNDTSVGVMSWCLVHAESGWLITRGVKRDDLIELANRFTAHEIDFTLSVKALGPFMWLMHEIIRDWFGWMNDKYHPYVEADYVPKKKEIPIRRFRWGRK